MNRKQEKILKYFVNSAIKQKVSGRNNMINLYVASNDLKIKRNDLILEVQKLDSLEYLEYIKPSDLSNQDFVVINEKGMSYFDIKENGKKKDFKNNFLFPLAVSIIGFCIGNLTQYLFQTIEHILTLFDFLSKNI